MKTGRQKNSYQKTVISTIDAVAYVVPLFPALISLALVENSLPFLLKYTLSL